MKVIKKVTEAVAATMAPHRSKRERKSTKLFATKDFRKKPGKQKKIEISTVQRKGNRRRSLPENYAPDDFRKNCGKQYSVNAKPKASDEEVMKLSKASDEEVMRLLYGEEAEDF